MGAQVLQKKVAVTYDSKLFSIIADEGTDVSNKEQLFFCVRTM